MTTKEPPPSRQPQEDGPEIFDELPAEEFLMGCENCGHNQLEYFAIWKFHNDDSLVIVYKGRTKPEIIPKPKESIIDSRPKSKEEIAAWEKVREILESESD